METLRALEDALTDDAGCAFIISHDRVFLDRIATLMLAFESDAHVEWVEGELRGLRGGQEASAARGRADPAPDEA